MVAKEVWLGDLRVSEREKKELNGTANVNQGR